MDESYSSILKITAWKDQKKAFNQEVNFDKFSLEVIASYGRDSCCVHTLATFTDFIATTLKNDRY